MKKSKSKSVFVVTACFLCALVLTACNPHQQPGTPSNPGTPKEETTVVEIMTSMPQYENLDMFGLLLDSTESLLQRNFTNPDIIAWRLNDKGDLSAYVNDNEGFKSAFLDLPSDYQPYSQLTPYTPFNIKQQIVLNKANLSSSLKVEEGSREEQETKQSIQSAISQITSELTGIANKSFTRINNYFSDAELYDMDALGLQREVYGKNYFNDGLFGAVCDIRKDGSLLAYGVDKNCQLVEYYAKFDGSDMSDPEKKLALITYETDVQKTIIDISRPYSAPSLGEDHPVVEETVTVGEIFDEFFVKTDFDEEFEAMLQRVIDGTYRFSTNKPLFYTMDDEKLTIYAEALSSINTHSLISATYDMPSSNILNNLNDIKTELLKRAGLSDSDSVKKSEKDGIVMKLNEAVEDIKEELKTLTLTDTSTKSYPTNNEKISNQKEFAEKLFPGKEIVAAYVGNLDFRSPDVDKLFTSNYITTFKMTVAYKENNNVMIYSAICFIPWLDGLSDQSLYNNFLTGEKDKTYKLRNEETTVVTNPHIVEEKTEPVLIKENHMEVLESFLSTDEIERIKREEFLLNYMFEAIEKSGL